MSYVLHKPKALLSLATLGLSDAIPGLADKPKSPKVPSAADAAKADAAAADEEARRQRAREKLRAGVGASLVSGATSGQFAQAGAAKKSLLGH